MIAHRWNNKTWWFLVFIGGFVACAGVSPLFAANISEFVNIRPYVEVGGGYDDNVFALSEDAPLPEDANEREDSYFAARAGIKADVTLERRLADLWVGLTYDYTYKKYSNNSSLDSGDHRFDFDFSFTSRYDSLGFFNDRLKVKLEDVLSYIPVDQEQPLLLGNRTWKNDLTTGFDYNLISKPRTAFILGYSYKRADYGDDPITVWTVRDNYDMSSDLTQASQSHTGRADFKHAFNSKLIYVLNYTYAFTSREKKTGNLTSADFTRQEALTGIEAKLTSKIHTNLKAGYSTTSYDDVDNLSQNDQDSFTGEASVTGNFDHRPLITVGYKRYYTENDFGDTLLTDDVFARVGFKIARGFIVSLTGDYILEDRSLYDDETKQTLVGIDTEYELVKNMKLLAGYNYRDRDFFQHDFLAREDRAETTHEFSGGLEYKITRYVLLRGMYYYTDKSSNIAEQEYSRNRFVANGRVTF